MKFTGHILTLLAMVICLTGCTSDMPSPSPSSGGVVDLVIRVGVNTIPGSGTGRINAPSRAAGEYPSGYPYDFEPQATIYEGINTLRVIIVDPQNVVEHNTVWNYYDHVPTGGELYGDMRFKVKGGEKKRVYLIANEASMTPAPNFEQYAPGVTLTPATAAAWLIYVPWNGSSALPYIDNRVPGKEKFVPMSEFFDVDIQKAGEEPVTQSEVLFITRSVVKFSFYLTASEEIPESFRITEIEFDKVMEKSYLMPNQTEYLPAKMPLTNNFRRIVTKFNTPGFSDNSVRPIVFAPSAFGLNAKGAGTTYSDSYIPQLYFCETLNNTVGNEFKLKLTVTWPDGKNTVYDNVVLPNLPSFPRNTHVKVYLDFADRSLTASVDLVPYIGIELKPTFGFDDIIKGEHRPTYTTQP